MYLLIADITDGNTDSGTRRIYAAGPDAPHALTVHQSQAQRFETKDSAVPLPLFRFIKLVPKRY